MTQEPSEDGVEASAAEQQLLTRRVLAVCDRAGSFIEYWGFKAIQGRMWTLLALRGEPMTQREIGRLLGVSRSAVSTTISELLERELVRPVGDHRNAPYEANLDVWPVITGVLREREWMMIESARLALEAAIEEAEIAAAAGEAVPFDVARMRLLLRMTEMGQAFLRLLLSLRAPKTPSRVQDWMSRAMELVRRLRAAGP